MKKLTDVLKYNKEIQKKNQEAVINQNKLRNEKKTDTGVFAQLAPTIPKLTGQVAPVVAQPNPLKKELEQVRLKRKKAYDKLMQSRQGNASGVDDPTLKADYDYYFQREKDLEYEIETGLKRGPAGASAYEDGSEILDDTFEGAFRTKEAYEWSRSRDNTRPAYGSRDYFNEYQKELNDRLEYVQQGIPKMTGVEESGYNSYLADPEALRATDPVMYNYWKNVDNKIKQADAISDELSRVNDILYNGGGNVKYKSVNTDITGDKTYEEYEGNLEGVSAKMTFERAALRGAENNIDKWNKMYENDSNFFEKLTYREFMEMQNDIKNYEETLSRYNASSEKYSDLIYKMKHFEVDSKFGIEKANEDKERYGELSNYYDKEESFRPVVKNGMFEAFRTEEEAQRDSKWDKVNGIMKLADDKIDAYTYFEKNKNNEYSGNTLGRIGANIKSGVIGEKIAKTGYNSWEAETDDIEAAKVYQALDERLRNTNKEAYTNYNAWDVYVSTLANYAPQFVNQTVASAKGRLAGAFAGLLFGNPAVGARIGASAASSVDMFQRTVGSQYVELLQKGDLSKEDAIILATNTALVSGALEFGLSYVSDKLVFGKSNVPSGALVDKLVAGGISRKGAQIMVNAAKFIGKQTIEGMGEGLEEFLQTGTEIVARKYAENGETVSSFQLLKDTFDFASYTKEDYAQMGQAALAGFIISAGSTGTIKGAISSYIDAVETVNTAEFGKQIKKAKFYADYVADALEYCKNSANAEIAECAKVIEAKLEKGKTLTDEEVGTIIKYSVVSERHNPFEITGGMVEKELKLEQSKSGLVTVYSKDWDVSADAETVKVIEGLAKLSNSRIVIEDLDAVEVTDENGNKKYAENMGYVENGIIHINSKNAKTKVGAIVTLHEVTHNLENSSMYGAYKDMAFEILYGGEGTEAYNEAYNEIANKYGDKVNSKDDIDKELVANFTMNNLDEQVINRIVMQNRPLAIRLFNALKTAYNKVKNTISGTNQDLSDIEKALDIFDRALKERRETIDNSDLTPFVDEEGNVQFDEKGSGEKQYALSENAREDVKRAITNKNYHGNIKLTDTTPTIMLYHKDVNNYPMLMNASHLRENILTEQEAMALGLKVNKDINYHGLGDTLFLKVIEGLDDVKEAYRGTKNADNKDRRENYFLLISEQKDADGNVINIPVYINDTGRYNNVYIDTNKIATVYGKNKLRGYIQKELREGNLVRIKKRNIQNSEWTSPINARYEMNVSNNNIPQPVATVNTNNMQKGKNDSEGAKEQFMLGTEVEETKDLIALHNASEAQLKEYLEKGYIIMPSVAVTNKSHTAFGDVTIILKREAIDPDNDFANKLYGSDAWTPTQTSLKINPKFNRRATNDVIAKLKKDIGAKWPQLFNYTSAQFEEAISKAQGNIYGAFANNLGMQTAYAMEKGLINNVPSDKLKLDKVTLEENLHEQMDKDNVWREYKKWLEGISDDIITSYDKATTQDIINSMKAQPATAKTFNLSINGELTIPAVEYGSIDELKRNKGRISESADEDTKAVGSEFITWANDLAEALGVETKKVVKVINSAFNERYDVQGIQKAFEEKGISISKEQAAELQSLYKKNC